ncbi:peptide/nickel transport system ATP-binding protein [Streptomyces sp. TverLS-915]|uniref:dipeptide ABC transporter ATP-binding protein n=1 Tax=Streptomyces sp. TverLS-915 TaxID=1839763 RepID=UPI00081EF5EC|nr:ABC transporter ATP-binding protein [Streptomyces sp. TverLS-915]SCD33857.1 peptide/nickel transport system ATP-binding protein [Streptomyces sp. TverLS-915]
MTVSDELLLEVRDLTVDFGSLRAVDHVSFSLRAGGALGIVGESGSGKSATAYALLDLHRGTGARVGGSVRLAGTDVLAAPERELRRLRGGSVAMVFQDPLSSLDPYHAIGDQIAEVHRLHSGASRRAARARAVDVLDRVGIPDAARRARSRPHEFSGGMRQRALIAMALACEPRLLVADEPTTALDVTVQAQILDLLHELRTDEGLGLVLVTHDVGVAAGSVDDVLVMKQGRVEERGPVREVLGAPRAPYTRALLGAVPRLDGPPARSLASEGEPLVTARELTKVYGRGPRAVTALDGVSLTVRPGESVGIVGESGSGKTTLGRMLVGLLEPSAGTVAYGGAAAARDGRRPAVQMVFQDPASSLNPRRSIGESIADPLRARGDRDESALRARVDALLTRVGLDPAHYDRYPHEFSGGQRQRVGIARALAPEPAVLLADEAVSALDVTTQAQVVALLDELRQELGLALVFVAHDLAVVRQVSERVLVLRAGKLVEEGPVERVYTHPADPYTRRLVDAVPVLDPADAAERRARRREARAGAEPGRAAPAGV